MDIKEWFRENCVYVPTKADRAIVREVIAQSYPADLEYIEDKWDSEYTYIARGRACGFSLCGGLRGVKHTVEEFLAIFQPDDTADISAVDLESIL